MEMEGCGADERLWPGFRVVGNPESLSRQWVSGKEIQQEQQGQGRRQETLVKVASA